jgi:predicted nuclease with TOPRIM domain
MSDMNERELLSAILVELRTVRAKVDAIHDELITFRRETSNNFNKVDRRLRFLESDYDQLNERLDRIETGNNH